MPGLEGAEAESLARGALAAWGLEGATLTLASQSENTVYRVQTAAGETLALRIHRPGYHDLAALNSEFAWTEALHDAGVRVPRPRRSLAGDGFVLAEAAAGGERRHVSMVEWVEGRLLGDVIEAAADVDAVRHFHALGRVAGRIHNQVDGWQPPPGFGRHVLDADGLLGPTPFWGAFWDHPALTPAQRRLILAGARKLRTALLAYGTGRDRFGLIHADLHPGNVLLDAAGVTVIDFDDAAYGWHAYELAVAVHSHHRDPRFPAMLAALLGGYREVRALDARGVAAVKALVAVRSIAIIGWLKERPEVAHAKRYAALLIEHASAECERLLSLSADAVI